MKSLLLFLCALAAANAHAAYYPSVTIQTEDEQPVHLTGYIVLVGEHEIDGNISIEILVEDTGKNRGRCEIPVNSMNDAKLLMDRLTAASVNAVRCKQSSLNATIDQPTRSYEIF